VFALLPGSRRSELEMHEGLILHTAAKIHAARPDARFLVPLGTRPTRDRFDAARYRLHWCKGCYFGLPSSLSKCVTHLVYPVPTKDSLGVHAVLDLGGRLKFGPDVEYLSERTMDYSVDENKRHAFAESVRRILPHVNDEDLTPDMAGLRPKLQAKGEPQRDFVIREESDRGLPGLINLIGIESPGLTASPAIAKMVTKMLA